GDIRIYPNPASSEINISSEKLILQLQIFTVSGNLLCQKTEINKNQTKINIDDFTPGIYVIQVFQEDGIKTLKIVVR
ncbi:MAG TPA: T9SS type A sorting domain-containing protein, partial [Draconibacterium sp.]|nr:T9SS type A sorting domain-containing protein [Draconibacterium sp.]